MDITQHSTTVLKLKGDTALSVVLAGLAAADAAHQRYEKMAWLHKKTEGKGSFPTVYFDSGAERQLDLYWDLKAAVGCFPASSLPEAAAQIGQAINEVDLAYDEFPEGEEIDVAYRQLKKKVERLLFSALNALEEIGSFKLDDMGLSSLRNSTQDPWAETEAVVQRVSRELAK
jgi:hypothetical protein